MHDTSMYGAVDLSGLGEAPQATENGATSGSIIIDVTADNLRTVLETSATVPVIAVFYTERAEQSVQVDSEFQTLAADQAGHFQLARVDVDAHPEIAQALGVDGVPAAVALLQGQPIPLFTGVPAAGQLGEVVEQVLQAGQQYGITGVLAGEPESGEPAEPTLPPHMAEAYAALEAGDTETARQEFSAALKVNPGLDEARIGIEHLELLKRVGAVDAQETLEKAQTAPLGDIDIHLLSADIEVLHGYPEAGFARLIDVITVTSGDEREIVRKRLLELFEIVGTEQPIVAQARKALASALF